MAKNACNCIFAKTYYHEKKHLIFSYTCLNPECDICGLETDPVWCALCEQKKEEKKHGQE